MLHISRTQPQPRQSQFENLSHDTVPFTLTHAAKGPKGLSLFEKQSAKHFLKLKKFKNLCILRKLYVDCFPFYNNQLKRPFSICFSAFCLPIQKVRTKTWFLKKAACNEGIQQRSKYFVIPLPPPCYRFRLVSCFRCSLRVFVI